MRAPSAIAALLICGCSPVHLWFPDGSTDGDATSPAPEEHLRLVPAAIAEADSRVCQRPERREERGPFEVHVDESGPAASSASMWSGGVVAGDLNEDGLLDVVAPFEPYSWLYRGRSGDAPLERVVGAHVTDLDLSMGSGGSVADADGDGDLDVLVLRYDRPVVLLLNQGDGSLVDGTAASGITAEGPTTSSSWGDLEGDGDLDLFVGAYGDIEAETPAHSYLFENVGDGTFVDRSERWLRPLIEDGFTRVGGFHDLDADGFPELYIVNDMGSVAPNVLLRNRGGVLVRDDNFSGLDLAMSGGGLGVGDVNNDDVPDLLIPQWDGLSLMVSGDGWWADQARADGLVPDDGRGQSVGWGAELADLDNDGDLDGLVAYGAIDVDLPRWENPEDEPDALFLQQDDGSFVDVAPEWGLDDPGKNRGFVVADFDNDGWLDVLSRNVDGPSKLYVSRCGEAHFLQVALRDLGAPNHAAIGARVKVVAGERSFSRWVNAGGTGYGTGGPPVLHFGLGEATEIDRIEVLWPDGATSIVGVGADVDQQLLIERD